MSVFKDKAVYIMTFPYLALIGFRLGLLLVFSYDAFGEWSPVLRIPHNIHCFYNIFHPMPNLPPFFPGKEEG